MEFEAAGTCCFSETISGELSSSESSPDSEDSFGVSLLDSVDFSFGSFTDGETVADSTSRLNISLPVVT